MLHGTEDTCISTEMERTTAKAWIISIPEGCAITLTTPVESTLVPVPK